MMIMATGFCLGTTVAAAVPMLMMTGRENEAAQGAIAGMVIHVLLCWLLIPPFGFVGAALASAATVVLRNAYFSYAVRRLVGVSPFLFAKTG